MNRIVLWFFIGFLALNASLLHAQEFQVGLKGGINKTFGGAIIGTPTQPGYSGSTFEAEGEIGFQGGIWTQISLGKFFIRPEIVYSKPESRFEFPQGPALYEIEVLSVPVLVGYNIFGPFDIYAGAAYNNIMVSTIERSEPLNNPPPVVVQDIPFSAQIGAKVKFGSFGLDIRYDHSLSSKQHQPLSIANPGPNVANPPLYSAKFDDARLNQLIVSLTLRLWDSEDIGKRRRRGGNCYF